MTVPDPTRRQLEVLQAYVDLGSAKAAGHGLGVSTGQVTRTLERARIRVGVESTTQLAVDLGSRGLLLPSTRHGRVDLDGGDGGDR